MREVREFKCISCYNLIQNSLFCSICGHIQAVFDVFGNNYYDIFGIDEAVLLDNDILEKKFIANLRLLHPDKFVTSSALERKISMENSAIYNKAYEVIREPIKAIEYILKSHGYNVDQITSEVDCHKNKGDLFFFFELHESIDAMDNVEGIMEIQGDFITRYRDKISECNNFVINKMYNSLFNIYPTLKLLQNTVLRTESRLSKLKK